MLEVQIRPRAMLDIDSIQIHLVVCTGSKRHAQRFLDDLYDALDKLGEFPGMGHVSPYAPEGSLCEYRRFLVGSLYWVYYTVEDEALTVWRVIHAKQEIDDYEIIGI